MQGIVLPDACRCCFSFPESVVARRKEDKEIGRGCDNLVLSGSTYLSPMHARFCELRAESNPDISAAQETA